jgi:hypothetical protein
MNGHERRLSRVQAKIESLLANRSTDDFAPPPGYRRLVLLESVLLARSSRSAHHDGVRRHRPCPRARETPTSGETAAWPWS